MIQKFSFLYVALFVGFCFMNLMSSCSCGTDTETSDTITNDSIAYIMGELLGEKYHNEYISLKYHGESVDLSKVAEEFDTVNKLCSNKGFLEGLWIYRLALRYSFMLFEEYNVEIKPSEIRTYTLRYLEDSTYFFSREDLPNYDVKEFINNNDSVSIYNFLGGYIAGTIDYMMKEEDITFPACKNEIYKGISYCEEMMVKPAIDSFCESIAIEAVLALDSMNLDANFSQQIAANAFKKALIDGVVKSRTEKKLLMDSTLEELLEGYEEVDKLAIMSIIE